jgi:hypothetical protein
VYIEFDGIGAKLDRAEKRRDRILGQRLMCSAMGDFLGEIPAHWAQAGLGVVALGM